MRRATQITTTFLVILTLVGTTCRLQKPEPPTFDWNLSSSLEKFTESEFADYVKQQQAYQVATQEYNQQYNSNSGFFDELGILGEGDTTSSQGYDYDVMEQVSDAPKQDNQNITNVQELGVDEGDIIKAHGDYLIVLSRGRLFTIQVQSNGVSLLKPIYKGNAYAEGFTNGTWYDELLIHEDTIAVVGYSYTVGATQVGIFDFGSDGSLTHRETFFIDSNDYYSSRNYASRLVNGQLIFYMPYYLTINTAEDRTADYQLPQLQHWVEGNTLSDPEDILNVTDIYKPVQTSSATTLHTIVTCDLTAELTCSAEAVLGPYARNFYVSPTTVYLWVSDPWDSYDYAPESLNGNSEPQAISQANAHVYAMPLDGSGVGVVQAYGTPLDQFSFKETDDGYLNVFVRENGFGEGMWNAEYSNSQMALVRFPLTAFSKEPTILSTSAYQLLPDPDGTSYGTLQNRFIGDYFVYGYGSNWYETTTAHELQVVEYKESGDNVTSLTLDSGVDRIEMLSATEAVIVGTNDEDLIFSWIRLDQKPLTIVDTYTLEKASQGETRSHGFFYSSSLGMLGLPVRSDDESGYSQLFSGSAGVVYLGVANNQFTELGQLKSTQDPSLDDDCHFSCVDWYGNARPVFYQDRVYALLGYELVEAERREDTLTEIRRTNFFVDTES